MQYFMLNWGHSPNVFMEGCKNKLKHTDDYDCVIIWARKVHVWYVKTFIGRSLMPIIVTKRKPFVQLFFHDRAINALKMWLQLNETCHPATHSPHNDLLFPQGVLYHIVALLTFTRIDMSKRGKPHRAQRMRIILQETLPQNGFKLNILLREC